MVQYTDQFYIKDLNEEWPFSINLASNLIRDFYNQDQEINLLQDFILFQFSRYTDIDPSQKSYKDITRPEELEEYFEDVGYHSFFVKEDKIYLDCFKNQVR